MKMTEEDRQRSDRRVVRDIQSRKMTVFGVLAAKASPQLRQTLESEVGRMNPKPIDALTLLDALDEMRCGLGVAIGRGEAGEDGRYQRLGQLVDWLYHELGAPQGSRYAVVQRAMRELSKRER